MPDHKPLKILQASAGSGKTFSLTAHYLTLLFSGETKYREILAVTFTNKATAEMKGRILEVLKSLANGEDSVETFRKIILNAHPHLNPDILQQQAHKIYRRILHDYSRFAINTIDGFVQKVIRSFSFELGLDAGYRLEMNTAKVKRELAIKLNKQLDSKPELLKWIIDLALERIRDNKSWNYHETLLNLGEEIFKERYQPFENALKVLDQTSLFKDLQKANKDIISFFEDEIKEQAKKASDVFNQSGVLLDELKKKSNNALKYLIKIADGGLDPNHFKSLKNLIDAPDEWQKGNLSSSVSQLYEKLNPLLEKLAKFYDGNLQQYQMAVAVDTNLYYLRLMQEMASLLGEYREENSTLLISDAQNLLRGITGDDNGNPSFIWEKMGSRYRHFLFDEFQDTSSFQWQNFLPLLQNAIAEANGKLIDHLIVGDVKQSIYRWRNGDWRILHTHAKKHIGEAFVDDDDLLENYRSTANIIDFNNFLFRHSPTLLQDHLNAKIIEEGGAELFESWWQKEGHDKAIQKAYGERDQQKAKATLSGGTIQASFIPVENNNHRASQIKEEALSRMANTLNGWICEGRYTAGQVCILVRSNREAREVIEFLLQHQQDCNKNDPAYKAYEVLSGEALMIANNSGIRLLLNTLYAMAGHKNEISTFKAACLQLYNSQHQKAVSPEQWIKLSATEPQNLHGYLPNQLCDNWFSWQQLPLPELVEQLIGAYGLNNLQLHIPYLIAFRDLIGIFSKQGERGISGFLEWWEDEGNGKALPSSEQSDAVQVITIHKSKGLAFDVVMMPFCSWDLNGKSDSIFWVDTENTPYSMLNRVPVKYNNKLGKSAFYKAYFEELLFNYMDALNMLYVAVTRTRKHLYITAPGYGAKEDAFTLAGDLIFKSLQLHTAEINAEFANGELLIEEEVAQKPVTKVHADERFTEKAWSFSSYPLSNRLSEALTDRKVYEQLDLLSSNSQQKRGLILHELLARASTISNLDAVLKEMITEGWLRSTEEHDILELAQSVLLQPDLKALLEIPSQKFNEQTIISSKGESYRPDKVLVGESQVVIIDFKFTGEPKPQHYKQVEEYRDLLAEMGYKSISGYLYYGYLKELKAV